MNKQKQIKEMYQEFLKYKFEVSTPETFSYKGMCEHFQNAGYRKIPEGAVVLTREEGQFRDYELYNLGYETHRQESQKREDYIETLLHHINDLENALINTRKETAEKFAERLKERFIGVREYRYRDTGTLWGEPCIGGLINNKIDEICKELTEGK